MLCEDAESLGVPLIMTVVFIGRSWPMERICAMLYALKDVDRGFQQVLDLADRVAIVSYVSLNVNCFGFGFRLPLNDSDQEVQSFSLASELIHEIL